MSKTVGDYVLKERIGKGSYADVYRGTHIATGVKYAIKAISKDILSEPKLLAGLESEIKIMREFAHENIVRLHEYFSSEKNFYLVLELCEGGDLSKFIKKKKRLDERLAQSFLTQITSGLAFLHEKNFIHRDLKPANVLLSEFSDSAVLKLADFGFARQLTVASLAQTRCGTPLYMAPEILESKDYDGKADIWSVGCIFYEMLVGTSPFKGTNEADLLMNIKTKELNVPKDVVLSKVSIEILIKLLERSPLRRAALPQLVALCAHLSSALPPPPSATAASGATSDESGFPVPSPSDGRGELSTSRRPQGTNATDPSRPPDSQDAQPSRRRLSSTSTVEPSMAEGMDPNFVSPARPAPTPQRGYGGGPAPSNLHGMFASPGAGAHHTTASTGHSADNYSPAHGGSVHSSTANTAFASGTPPGKPSGGAQQDGYSSRRYSAGGQGGGYGTPPTDPQFSKTVRAPYANLGTNKYPSPSSSPPTGGMSAVGGGFLQGSTARSQVAPSTSPASATMGMVGNLIAYVFNPTPSPTAAVAESSRPYAHGQHSKPSAQHGRSVSLDRATPPHFAPHAGFFAANGGSGTPPSGTKSRAAPGRPMREDHFAYPDPMDATGARNNSSSLSVDDDFVMINNSASESDRKHSRGHTAADTPNSRPGMQPSTASSSSNSSGVVGASIANSYAGTSNVGRQGNNLTEYDMEHDARANETAAMQAFYASLVQRCEVYCAVVSAITALGDQYVREVQAPLQRLKQQQFDQRGGASAGSITSAEDDDGDSIAGFLQPPTGSTSSINPHLQQVSTERYLIACALYLHALSILSRLMKSFDSNAGMEQTEQMKSAMQKLKSDLSTVFEQLISRAESSQKQIDAIVNPKGMSASTLAKYAMPQAEPIMIQAALQRESDAGMEELLGNLNLASKLYLSANELVEGVALTANDPEDQRKLQAYMHSLMEKHNACKQRAAELLIYS